VACPQLSPTPMPKKGFFINGFFIAARYLNVRSPLLVRQAQWQWRSTREGRARKGKQPDPAFTRDRFSLKHSQGGGGFRPTVEHIPFLNPLFSALPAISGSTAQAPLWPSLAPIFGGPERLRQG